MPFELIMLMGFFGTILLSLLPARSAQTAEEGFRERRLQRRSDGERRKVARHGRQAREATGRREAIRVRRGGSVAA